MMAQTETDKNTQLGEMLDAAMNEKGMSIRELAKAVDTTYEHVRRLVRGEGAPSKFVLRLLCENLGIDYHEAEKLATADKIFRKYGGIPLELVGKDPALEPMARLWAHLDSKQQASLLDMAKSMVRVNRATPKN